MKLSYSNIAWNPEQDLEMYEFLQKQGFTGLEIAPTRLFPDNPYDSLNSAREIAETLKNKYGLSVSSMQSIWYGKSESIFGSDDEKRILVEYTKKAIDFAAVISCKNLVFGCPKNRNMPESGDVKAAEEFFFEIASYAVQQGTVIALEPNPPIYGTNFINFTKEAFEFAKRIDGLAVNVDFGTIIENNENLQIIAAHLDLVNHVHISEPYLERIVERDLHKELCDILKSGNYNEFVSVEMKNLGDIDIVKKTAEYVRRVFG